MKEIVQGKYNEIPKNGLARLRTVDQLIKEQMEKIIPVFERDLRKGHDIMMEQATNIRNIIDAVISDIHLNTLHSAKTYDDVYERFGPDRRVFSSLVLVLLFLVSKLNIIF